MGGEQEMAKIQCKKNGPLIVDGVNKLQTLGADVDYPTEERMALCRCGKSQNKPFCDGAHSKVGFDDAKQEDRTPDRRKDYKGQSVTIHYNGGICAHAGVCTNKLASVFRYGERPWIVPDGGSLEQIDEVINACPSGALSYSVDGVEHAPDYTGEAMILVAPGGPYAVKGSIELDGVEWGEGARKDCFDLCRCGKSKNKPFCDGAHWNTKFDADAEAD